MLDISAVERSFDQLCHPHHTLALAVSGGSDSLALALLAKHWADTHQVTLVALTVDHGLRAEAAQEAQQVHHWMQVHHLPHHILTWDGEKPRSNIQAEARKIRYQLMQEFCQHQNIALLCTGHTIEDQAETFLLRLERDSGVSGLSAMNASTSYHNLTLVRPLLDFHREDLRTYLTAQTQSWIEDPSNEDLMFERVKIRQWMDMHPDPKSLTTHIAQSVKHLQRTRDFLETQCHTLSETACTFTPYGTAQIDLPTFCSAPSEIQWRFLNHLLMRISGADYPPRFEKIARLQEQLHSPDFQAATLHGCHCFRSEKKHESHLIHVVREHTAITETGVTLSARTPVIWDQRFSVSTHATDTFHVSKIEAKDGPTVRKHLSANNLSILQRILFSLPAIYALEKLVAIPHIDYYSDVHRDHFEVQLIQK